MTEAWTIRRVVAWTTDDFASRGFASPRLEADLLVAKGLGVERIALYLDPDRPLSPQELVAIRGLVKRRRGHEPVAYIVGQREFYGRSFAVSADVLIPRPDTETLVEAALAAAPKLPEGAVVDLCTGSGVLAVTLALEQPGRSVIATDISAAALEVARRNAEAHGVLDRIDFRQGDALEPLDASLAAALMVVNPPYVRSAELASLEPDVRDHEPHLALDGGPDGLRFYRQLAARAADFLAPGGRLLMEVGYDQAAAVGALFEGAPFRHLSTLEDLSGALRVVSLTRE